MERAKVAVESYQEYKIKEITLDGREILIPADTLATYFASLVERFQFVERDPVFSAEAESKPAETVQNGESTEHAGATNGVSTEQLSSDEQQNQNASSEMVENEENALVKAEPLNASDKEKSRPTLESIKRHLQSALTEFTVLSDLFCVAARYGDRWINMGRVANPEVPSENLNALVAAVKRAGLQAALRHVSAANEQLVTARRQSSHPASYINQLVKMRKRWKMRRTVAGLVVGDLSFCSVGSRFGSQRPPTFEAVQLENSPNDATDGGIDVVLPPGLDLPVTVDLLLSDPDDPDLSCVSTDFFALNSVQKLPPITTEAKLAQAQLNLFYEELFATLANDALQHKIGDRQVVVTRDSLTCRLSPNSHAVLTITLSRGFGSDGNDSPKKSVNRPSLIQSSVSRGLLLTCMTLLRKIHNENLQHPTLPSTAPLTLTAGSEKKSMLGRILDQARHVITRRRLERKLDGFSADIRSNYAVRLVIHWSAITSPTFCTARMTVISPGYDNSRTYSMIIVDIDSVRVIAKDGSVFEIDDELQLLRIHVGELVHDYFIECGQRMALASGLVPRPQRSAVGLSSLRLLTVTHPSFASELNVLMSPDGPPQVRIQNTFFQSVSEKSIKSDNSDGEAGGSSMAAGESAFIDLSFLPGSSFLDKLQNLFSIFSLRQ